MSYFLRVFLIFLLIASCVSSKADQREFLDSRWEKYMVDGPFAIVSIENGKSLVSVERPPDSVDPNAEEITFPTLMSHPISVQRLVEGTFGNGGWSLDGGPLMSGQRKSIHYRIVRKAGSSNVSLCSFSTAPKSSTGQKLRVVLTSARCGRTCENFT